MSGRNDPPAARAKPALADLSAAAKASRKPLPPEELVDAQHDRVHEDRGRFRAARTVRNKRRGTDENQSQLLAAAAMIGPVRPHAGSGAAMKELYWHCLQCGANDPVEPTGGTDEYVLGDHEPCITCGTGTAHVMTIRLGAAYEQGFALGMSIRDAWARARQMVVRA